MLKVVLFGTPQVILDQRNLTATLAGRPLALLAYLAVTDQPHDRNLLADLLWAEIGETEARRNLRNILYLLRQAVGDYLLTDRQTVMLATTHPRWVDVTIFAEQLATRQQAAELAVEPMPATLALYEQIKRGESLLSPARPGASTHSHTTNGRDVDPLVSDTPAQVATPAQQHALKALGAIEVTDC